MLYKSYDFKQLAVLLSSLARRVHCPMEVTTLFRLPKVSPERNVACRKGSVP